MMGRLFIFNEMLNENVKNIQIIDYVGTSFGLDFHNSEKNCLLNTSERHLNEYEASFDFGSDFDFDFNFERVRNQSLK